MENTHTNRSWLRRYMPTFFSRTNQSVNIVVAEVEQDIFESDLNVKEPLDHGKKMNKLNEAMNDTLKEKIRILFYRSPQNGAVGEDEFEQRWIELKRYFLMCSLLKDVPMFSSDIDEVWHTLILSTRDYSKCCEAFMGEFLHHNPATSNTPNPHGRAWFDFIYTELFHLTDYSARGWGAFYQFPLRKEQIETLRKESVSEIRRKYFRMTADPIEVESLILRLKKQVEVAIKKGTTTKRYPFRPQNDVPFLLQASFFVQAMIYYSFAYVDQYHVKMNKVQVGFAQKSSSCSACGSGSTMIELDSCGSD